jgi:hypothetical protein
MTVSRAGVPSGPPVALDMAGRDIQGEAARLREGGPAVPVMLPGGGTGVGGRPA